MQLLDEAALRNLAGRDADEVRSWLRRHQPDSDADRRFWWENTMTRALQETYGAATPPERDRYAHLVAIAIEEAVAGSAMSAREGVIRAGNLAAFQTQRRGHLPASLAPDRLVRQAISLLGVSVEEARQSVAVWRSLPIAEIALLRWARNVISAVAPLLDEVRDPDVRDDLARWVDLRDQLP
jgi:hypothetical protein